MSRFATVSIGALTMTDTAVTIASGKPLVLGGDASSANHAITKSQLDTVATELRGAITTIAGSDTAFDTLAEMKAFVDGVKTSGAANLLTAVTDETTARGVAVAAATAAASSALAGVDTSIRTLVANEVASRAAADTLLRNRLFHHVNVQMSPATIPDEASPTPMPTTVKAVTGVDGWYFKNGGPSSSTRKFNWYFGAPVNSTGTATGASLEELDIRLRLVNNVSAPFITFYTAKTGSNDAASWYHAKYTYIANQSLTANTNYLFRVLVSGSSAVGSLSGFSNVDLTLDSYSSTPNSTLLATDTILFIAVSSNSSSAAGNVECVIHGLDIHSTNGNVAYHLSNNDVVHKYIGTKLTQLYLSMGQADPMLGIA